MSGVRRVGTSPRSVRWRGLQAWRAASARLGWLGWLGWAASRSAAGDEAQVARTTLEWIPQTGQPDDCARYASHTAALAAPSWPISRERRPPTSKVPRGTDSICRHSPQSGGASACACTGGSHMPMCVHRGQSHLLGRPTQARLPHPIVPAQLKGAAHVESPARGRPDLSAFTAIRGRPRMRTHRWLAHGHGCPTRTRLPPPAVPAHLRQGGRLPAQE